MAASSVTSGATRIKHALRDLLDKWDQTTATWHDSVSREFEERQIAPLESAIQASMKGMQELAEVLSRVRAECSDRNEGW